MFCVLILSFLLTISIGSASEEQVSVDLVGSYAGSSYSDIDVIDDYLYVACYSGGFDIVNVSNTSNTNCIYTSSYRADSIAVSPEGYAYVFDAASKSLRIVNVTNKSIPQMLSSVGGLHIQYTNSHFQVEYQNENVVVEDFSGMRRVNVSDPLNPEFASGYFYSPKPAEESNYEVVGDYVFRELSGLLIINMSTGSIVSYSDNLSGLSSLAVSYSSYQPEPQPDYVYLAVDSGLVVLDVTDPLNPTYLSLYQTAGDGVCIDLNRDSIGDQHSYVYLVEDFGDDNYGLDVIDISDPESPYLAGQKNFTEDYVWDMDVTHDTVYVSGSAVKIFEVSEHDTTLPEASITSHSDEEITLNNTITLIGTATDDVGVSKVTVNGILANGTTNWNANISLLEGENTVTVVARDYEGNEVEKSITIVYVIDDNCHSLFTGTSQVEIGGTYYRWYQTIPYSTISMDSEYLTYSQPDKNGIFNVSIDTEEEGFSEGSYDISASNITLSIANEVYEINPLLFNFSLEVLPRDYSTSWYISKNSGGGVGYYVYADTDVKKDFKLTSGILDSNLIMNRDIDTTLTTGTTTSGFEAQVGPVEASMLSADLYTGFTTMKGSQVHVDYENAEDSEKLESALYILSSVADSNNPLIYKAIDSATTQIEEDLSIDYYESGIATFSGVSVDLFSIGIVKDHPTKNINASATLANLGVSGEISGSSKSRYYPEINYQECLIQRVRSAEVDSTGPIGSLIDEWFDSGWSSELDQTVIFGYDENDRVYGKAVIKDNVYSGESTTRQVIYDYGDITESNVLNPFQTEEFKSYAGFTDFFDKSTSFTTGNISIQETKDDSHGIDIPLSVTVASVKLSLHKGIELGTANNYVTEKKQIYNKNPYTVEKYSYDSYVDDSTHALTDIFGELLEPVGTALQSAVNTLVLEISSASDIIFSGGSISIPQALNGNISVTSFETSEPETATVQMFSTMGVSSSVVTSISGADFVIGNITDLQPYNVTLEKEAILMLNYDDSGITDETNISIYKWNDSFNAWLPLDSTINETSNEAETNISCFGTYAAGYDQTVPVLQWNASLKQYDKVQVSARITDSGSGINSSSITLYVDGNQQNFSYNMLTGMLNSTVNTSVGTHSVSISAYDTSGNSAILTENVSVIEPVEIINLDVNYQGNDSIIFEWETENGTYSLDHFSIYQNAALLQNITSNTYVSSKSEAMYMIYPVDTQGNIGYGIYVYYQDNQLMPLFCYDGNSSFRPTVGNSVNFNASDSYVVQGTIETNISSYTWIFNDDIANATSGKIVNHVFDTEGLNKIKLVIEDEQQNNASLIKVINVSNSTHISSGQIINGGFETGDVSGWTVTTDESGPGTHIHTYNVSEEHNYSGTYGCELFTNTCFISTSSISLTQNVNLTDIDYFTFNHQCTYEYSGTSNNSAYSQLEFYVDDDVTAIPLFNNSSIINVWKIESVDVSNYIGYHNVTLRLYSTAPLQPSIATAKVEIDNVSLIHAQKDWNPWNEPDSDDGLFITTSELQEAINCSISNYPAPITGAEVNEARKELLLDYWVNGIEMPEGTDTSPLILANRTIYTYNVTANSSFNVVVNIAVDMASDQQINCLELHENLPLDWSIISEVNSGWNFDNSTDTWLNSSTISGKTNLSITYDVLVPSNLTTGIYNISGFISSNEVISTNIYGDSQVNVIDWNPWNDMDSDNGLYITTSELLEAIHCYSSNEPAPITGAEITEARKDLLLDYWVDDLEMPEGTDVI